MSAKEQFLSPRQRYRPISLPQNFSDEAMARDWTLSESDTQEIGKYRTRFRLFIAIQLCAVRLYGRFLDEVHDLSPRIVNYLNGQLDLLPSLTIQVPDRKATYTEQRRNILNYLGFQIFDAAVQVQLQTWLAEHARQGILPGELFRQAEDYLLARRSLLPGPSVLERLIVHVCADVHARIFEEVYQRLSPELRQGIGQLLTVPAGEQRSSFSQLKAYPPAATLSSLRTYLRRYRTVAETGIDAFEAHMLEPAFLDYLFKLAQRYSTTDLKRFNETKCYALMVCFLLETRQMLLDHLVKMHDQYIMEMGRQAKNAHNQKYRQLRRRQKQAIDTVLDTTSILLEWPDDLPLSKRELWQQVDETKLRASLDDLRIFKRLEERGYGDLLLARYASLRKYFAEFIHLPFVAEQGSDPLIQAIHLVRKLGFRRPEKAASRCADRLCAQRTTASAER